MKFTRLRLHGFKSFSDPTELHIEPGVTGIVGPNGCGKSNLLEALRWVMGESSYKAMRGAGMDDVIFAGSAGRPGRNSAEVTLVLDNADRTAPAPLNNADVLEVTRRIEREEGSIYRVNGREVRARDVQLLFADASTGAHSPALVRQGQINELIAAKPTQRRALLEEAAGISGLHSRRHEAELRLRAAEQNLERVDDVIAQIEQQLEQLKRQARLAVRYRSLSGDIRRAEATLSHIRWVAARFAEKEAEAEQARLTRELADAQHIELEAQKEVFLADKALTPLREKEAAAGAALQRLTILAEQLAEEARRMEARKAELTARLGQIEADLTRERTLLGESDEVLARYAEEAARLEAETAGEADAFAAARAAMEAAQADVATAEINARTAAEALSALRAKRAAAQRNLDEARARIGRVQSELNGVIRDSDDIARRLAQDSGLSEATATLEAARARTVAAEAEAVSAETRGAAAQAALDARRPELQAIESALGRLEAEAQTLQRVLAHGGAGDWPAIVDALTVKPGYETALGAALGFDLEASSDTAAPLHWAGAIAVGDPALPQGAIPLTDFVNGSPLLARRLAQIGLVEEADGPRIAALLKPGQRLVSRKGALWRWDGFVAVADAPTAAAERLAQRNRLADLAREIEGMAAQRQAIEVDCRRLAAALNEARTAERLKRDAWRQAQHAIGEAQKAVDRAQQAAGQLNSRQSALREARSRLEQNLNEARAGATAAEAAVGDAGDETAAAFRAASCQSLLKDARDRAEEARLKLGTFETASRMRQGRLSQIAGETAAWDRRRSGAAAQIATLEARVQDTAAERDLLAATPDGHAERQHLLDEQIAAARTAHGAAADALAAGDTRHREAAKVQRSAAEALSGVREQLGRVEERINGIRAQRHQIERLVEESLGIPASRTAEAAGLKPEQALPNEADVEARLERLKAERERLGGVNLGAEREAEEVQERLDTMVADRDDLIAAIGKLRGGIQSLNREGRTRLSEAFDKVNGHFQELFTTLFGGGHAELQFVESDDPLEAGLEIIARPPGKKPSTMTLLSGGEQALVAMSLIFAVFLTNPAPICVLDEVDAPLDDANVERFCNLLDLMTARTRTRFMVMTHNPITMSRVDRLFGVTMAERGVSQLVSVDLRGAFAVREAS